MLSMPNGPGTQRYSSNVNFGTRQGDDNDYRVRSWTHGQRLFPWVKLTPNPPLALPETDQGYGPFCLM